MIRAQIPTPARRAATLLGVVLVLATIATLVARQYWFFELFSHFRWQYVTAAVLATPVLWLCGRRALAILCVAALGIHALALMQQRFATLERSTGTERQLRIVSFNVFHRNAEYAEALAEIERISPDIVCLYETTDAWRQHLAKLSARYAFALFTGNGPHSGVACLSRIVPLRVVPPDANARAAPWMQLELESGGTRFRVVGVHLGYPLGAAAMRARNRQLLELAQVLRGAGEPVIVVGDFNLTPYSPYNDDFLQASGLTDCSQGRALQPTWPVWFPPLWMTIDRCFVTAGIAVAGYRVGPSLGSDHNSLVIDFRP